MPSRCGQRRVAVHRARSLVPATAQPAPAKSAPSSVTVISGCRPKPSWPPRTSRPVAPEQWPDQRARGDERRRGRDLAVGHGEDHDVGAAAVGAAAERALDLDARRAAAHGQSAAQAAVSDDVMSV